MLVSFADYYGELYNLRSDPHSPQPSKEEIITFLEKIKQPKLSEAHLAHLNSPITPWKIGKIIASLPNGKSPGPDGLSNEYYKIFSTTLIPHLNNVYLEATHTSSFPQEMLKVYIVTIPKPGKDPTTPANFRP